MYRLSFYVPESHLETVKQAVFAAGAGCYPNYDQCCWQTQGQGQFMPLAGSNPYVGEAESLEKVAEYKVEMVCRDEFIKNAVQALINSHPYEKPAYEVYPILAFDDLE